jgi:hypothetical protein
MTVAYGHGLCSRSSVDRGDPWEFAKARLSIATQDGPAGLRRVRGDDQVVCAARGAGPAYVGEQAPMVRSCRLGVVKDIEGRCYGRERPGAFGRPSGRIR